MTSKIIANTRHSYKISTNDLPLCCPTPKMEQWSSHPRVYLAIEATGHATCPYCGTQFTLIKSTQTQHSH